MRKLALLLLCAASAPAFAADLPAEKAPAYVPPPPVLSWTGVYIGGQIGIQSGQTSWNRYDASDTDFIATEDPYSDKGVVGGGHIGYNFQVDQFVFGLEGDVEDTNFNGNGTSNGNTWANTTRADIEASIRARAGLAWNQFLIFVTGGGAWANLHVSAQNPPGVFYAGENFGRFGWTGGGGVEYALDPNWSILLEDRFTDYGRYTFYTGTENIHQDLWDNRVEAGFSYRFDFAAPPAPVVAKY